MEAFVVALQSVWNDSGFSAFTMGNAIMMLVGIVLLYLAIGKGFEPLLLSPIAFGCLLANVPKTGFEDQPGVMQVILYGINHEIFPPLIFLGVGAMTDKPCHTFQISHIHIRIHSFQPRLQAGNRLVGRREEPGPFIRTNQSVRLCSWPSLRVSIITRPVPVSSLQKIHDLCEVLFCLLEDRQHTVAMHHLRAGGHCIGNLCPFAGLLKVRQRTV